MQLQRLKLLGERLKLQINNQGFISTLSAAKTVCVQEHILPVLLYTALVSFQLAKLQQKKTVEKTGQKKKKKKRNV